MGRRTFRPVGAQSFFNLSRTVLRFASAGTGSELDAASPLDAAMRIEPVINHPRVFCRLNEISRLRDALAFLIKTGTIASLRYRLGARRPSAISLRNDAARHLS